MPLDTQPAPKHPLAPYDRMDLVSAQSCVRHDLAVVRRAAASAPYPHIKAKREANAVELERIADEIAARLGNAERVAA